MKQFRNIDSASFDPRWTEAVNRFNANDKSGALFLFKRLAYEGCAPALMEVGNIYELGGTGVKRDFNEAKKWYHRAVEVIDDVNAHMALGRLYLKDANSNDDYLIAQHHFRLLVDHDNNMCALYGLGLIYELGLGVKKNVSDAVGYYEAAISQGHILAKRNLAKIIIKDSFFCGFCLLLESCVQIFKIGIKNPHDRRLGISYH